MDDDDLTYSDYQAVAEAVARQNAIDRDEAGPKAPHGTVAYRGILLDSRWDVLAEYRAMRAIVDRLPDLVRVRIESIWCDSKCTSYFVLTVKPHRFVRDLPLVFEDSVVAVCGGHNGILIQSDDAEGDLIIDCNWDE